MADVREAGFNQYPHSNSKNMSFLGGMSGISKDALSRGFVNRIVGMGVRMKGSSRFLLFCVTAALTFYVVKLNIPGVDVGLDVVPVQRGMDYVNKGSDNITHHSGTQAILQRDTEDAPAAAKLEHAQAPAVKSANSSSKDNTPAPNVNTGKTIPTCTNEQRVKNAKAACERLKGKTGNFNKNSPGSYGHIMVDDKHKVLYCYVPKAGCTSWKHVIALQSGMVDNATLQKRWGIVHEGGAQKVGMRRLSGNKIADIHKKLKEYTKFLIVRNPLSRIYSAYNDKFIQFYKTYAKTYYRGILRQLYPKLPVKNKEPFLSFELLIKMIVRAHKKRERFLNLAVIDEHWRIVTNMCHICHIDYDYIGKIETMDQDKDQLLKLFNATSLPHAHENANTMTKSSNIFNYKKTSAREAYSKIPKDTLKDLTDIFRSDFEIFGYQSAFDDTEAKCGYQQGDKCC